MIFFRPTTLTLFHGQISAWLLLILSATLFLWEKDHWEWGSFLLSFLMLKPNLGAPLVILLGGWLFFQKRYRSILVMLFTGLVLLGVGFVQNPHWLSAYWGIGNTKLAENFGGSPTVWGLSHLLCRSNSACMPVLGGVATFLLLLVFGWLVFRRANKSAYEVVALAVSLTLLVTPYTWTYDQLMLIIPITSLMLALDRSGRPFLVTASLFLGIDLLIVFLLIFDNLLHVEILNVIIPLLVFGLCAWLLPGGRRSRSQGKLPTATLS